jgi:hypothetical protein
MSRLSIGSEVLCQGYGVVQNLLLGFSATVEDITLRELCFNTARIRARRRILLDCRRQNHAQLNNVE